MESMFAGAGSVCAIDARTWLLGGTWWLYISMHTYGGMPPALAVSAVALLSFALAWWYGLAIWVYRRTILHDAPALARVLGSKATHTVQVARGRMGQ